MFVVVNVVVENRPGFFIFFVEEHWFRIIVKIGTYFNKILVANNLGNFFIKP